MTWTTMHEIVTISCLWLPRKTTWTTMLMTKKPYWQWKTRRHKCSRKLRPRLEDVLQSWPDPDDSEDSNKEHCANRAITSSINSILAGQPCPVKYLFKALPWVVAMCVFLAILMTRLMKSSSIHPDAATGLRTRTTSVTTCVKRCSFGRTLNNL